MTTQTTCPQCNAVMASERHTNADYCPACGFKFARRGRMEMAKGLPTLAAVGYILVALAGAVLLIGYLSRLLT